MIGIENEIYLLNFLKEKIDKGLEMAENKYSVIDYISKNTLVELKSRRNEYRKYPDTMVGANKIKYMLNDKVRKSYCVFSFTDGLYYIEITKDAVGKFRRALGGRRDRGKDETSTYYYIPINMLKNLTATTNLRHLAFSAYPLTATHPEFSF